MRTRVFGILGLVCALGLLALSAQAATIYLTPTNISGTYDGKSWATAFTNVTDALSALAATNAVAQGDHTVLFGEGSYTNYFTINNTHSGLSGHTNTFKANTTNVVIKGISIAGTGGGANAARYIAIDGFRITPSGLSASGSNEHGDILVQNCLIYRGIGINIQSSLGPLTVRHCTLAFNSYGINIGFTTARLYDCVIFGNYQNGACQQYANVSPIIPTRCVFFGNGREFTDQVSGTNLTTGAQIDTYTGGTNNLVMNPGYANLLAGMFDFATVYANSPLIGTGEAGSNIGCDQSLATVPITEYTYYVAPAPAGDDSRTPTQARSVGTPWATITNAVANATGGDTIVLADGAYNERVIIGLNGSSNSVFTLRASGTNAAITGTAPALTLTNVFGATIQGIACKGINLLYAGDNTLQSVSVTGAAPGIAISYGGGNQVLDCRIFANTGYGVNWFATGFGAAGYDNTLDRCAVYSNANAGAYLGGYSLIRNCMFYGGSSYGAYYAQDAVGPIYNSTFYGNQSGVYFQNSNGGNIVYNCIFASNTQYAIYCPGTYSTIRSINNCFWTNGLANYRKGDGTLLNSVAELDTVGTNNVIADPKFKQAGSRDFHILFGSPCFNAGTNLTRIGTLDFYGNQRVQGLRVDIGANESAPVPKGTIIMIY